MVTLVAVHITRDNKGSIHFDGELNPDDVKLDTGEVARIALMLEGYANMLKSKCSGPWEDMKEKG